MFAIVLQHCPEDLVQRLKSKDDWLDTNTTKNVINLTHMTRDLAHAHDDKTQGTMVMFAIVLQGLSTETKVKGQVDRYQC